MKILSKSRNFAGHHFRTYEIKYLKVTTSFTQGAKQTSESSDKLLFMLNIMVQKGPMKTL